MSNLWLLVSLVVVQCVSCLKIIPQEPEYVVTLKSTETDPHGSFILTCTDTENITWAFSKKEDTVYTLEYHQQNGLHMLILNVSNISYLDTGNYVCKRQLQKTRNDRAEIYVYLFDNLHFLAVKDDFAVLQSSENKSIIIPCKPTLPNITVILYNTEDDNEMNLPFDPKKGFILDMPTVKDSKYVRCEGTNNSSEPADETNQKVFHLLISTSSMSARPFITPSGTLPPVEGKPLSLNCSVQLSIESTVFINWKYPNDGSKNRSTELSQQEFIHADGGKVNYKILTFFNLSKSDTGNYTCEIEDTRSDDSVSSYAYYLNVFDPKESFLDFKILTDMTNYTQKTGFPKVQWMLNVTSHPAAKVSCKVPNGLVVSNTDSSSTTKYQLTVVDELVKFAVLNLDVNDTGIYEFTADNGDKKKTVNISIYIEDKPEIQMAKKYESSLVNEFSEVECSVIGYPLPKISWFALKCNNYPSCEQYVSTELTLTNFKIANDNKRPHLITSTLHYRTNETTLLTCSASNSMGSNSSSIPFFVSDVINDFSVSVSSYEITVDDNVNITCQASKYIYQNNIIWHYSPDGLKYYRVENSRNVKISSSVTKFSYKSVINITGIQKSHGGYYQCSVKMERGSADVESVAIKVNDVEYPFIDSTNLNSSSFTIDAIKGKHAFYCFARGVPKPTLTWYKDQRPLVIRKNDTDNLSLSPDNRTLTIKFPQAEHAGEYKCEAKNKVGNVVRRGFLVVKGGYSQATDDIYISYAYVHKENAYVHKGNAYVQEINEFTAIADKRLNRLS